MKIQIKSLRAVNCGPLKDIEIDFTTDGIPRPITLLMGANGTGKTTILELIVSLLEELQPKDRPDYLPASPSKNANIELLVNDETVDFSTGQNIQRLDGQIVVRGRIYRQLRQEIESAQGSELTSRKRSQAENPSDMSAPSVLYFPHNRFLSPVVGEQIQKEETHYQWIYKYDPATRFQGSLDSYLVWLDYAEPESFEEVADFLSTTVLPGKRFKVERKSLKAVVVMTDGTQHDVSQLSSGEQNLIIMLLELHRRLMPNSIVLIDEIENSLHLAFQHRIGQALKAMQRETPFQLIVTTHSPVFIKIFGSASTLILPNTDAYDTHDQAIAA